MPRAIDPQRIADVEHDRGAEDGLRLANRSIHRMTEIHRNLGAMTLQPLPAGHRPPPRPVAWDDHWTEQRADGRTDRSWIEFDEPFKGWAQRVGNRVGWFGLAFLVVLLAPTWPLAALAVVLVVLSVWAARRIAHRRAERQRLIADCDRQHAALMRGDDTVGIYGRFPCPPLRLGVASAGGASRTWPSPGHPFLVPAGDAPTAQPAERESATS